MLVCSVSSVCATLVRYKKTSSSNRHVSVPYFPAHLIRNGKWKQMIFVKSCNKSLYEQKFKVVFGSLGKKLRRTPRNGVYQRNRDVKHVYHYYSYACIHDKN